MKFDFMTGSGQEIKIAFSLVHIPLGSSLLEIFPFLFQGHNDENTEHSFKSLKEVAYQQLDLSKQSELPVSKLSGSAAGGGGKLEQKETTSEPEHLLQATE